MAFSDYGTLLRADIRPGGAGGGIYPNTISCLGFRSLPACSPGNLSGGDGPPGYLFGSAGLLPEWLRSAKTGSHNEYWSLPGDTGRFVSRSIHQRYGPKAYLRRSASPSQPQIDFFTLKQLKPKFVLIPDPFLAHFSPGVCPVDFIFQVSRAHKIFIRGSLSSPDKVSALKSDRIFFSTLGAVLSGQL